MNRLILWTMALAWLASGCAETRQYMGATAEADQNVLTGGPILGTRVQDLPEPVQQVLRQQASTAEVLILKSITGRGISFTKQRFSCRGKTQLFTLLMTEPCSKSRPCKRARHSETVRLRGLRSPERSPRFAAPVPRSLHGISHSNLPVATTLSAVFPHASFF